MAFRSVPHVLGLMLLTACGPAPDSLRSTFPAGDVVQLLPQGSVWAVETITDFPLPADNGILLRRDARGLNGTTACNQFRAPLSHEGDRIAIGPIMLTRRACLGNAAGQEAAFTNALGQVNGVADGGGGRVMLTRDGIAILTLIAPAAKG